MEGVNVGLVGFGTVGGAFCRLMQANGELFERALCYHAGVAEQYLWPMVDEIMAR